MSIIKTIFKNRAGQLRAGWDILLLLAAVIGLARVCSYVLSLRTGSGYLFDPHGWVQIFKEIGPYIVITVCFAVRVVQKKPLSSIGLTVPDGKRLFTGFLAGAFLLTAVIVILLGVGAAEFQGVWSDPQWGRINLIGLVTVGAVAGISEEVLFRGYIQHLLSSRLSPLWGMTIIAGAFALAHMANDNFTWLSALNIALVSFIFSLATLRTGNLYFAIALHAAWNMFQGYVFGVAVSGNPAEGLYTVHLHGADWLSGGAFGVEGSVITTLVLGLACMLMWIVPVHGQKLRLDRSGIA